MISRLIHNERTARNAKPYCQCWNQNRPRLWESSGGCACGEHADISEWRWEMPESTGTSWVMMCPDQKQVTFHPFYSSGTAAVKGDTPLVRDYHYYWEIKMLTEPYGTDIMVGLGTNKVNMADSLFTFTSFLGRNGESYGLSYTGALRHNASVTRDNVGFCKGSIIGVKVDLWQGTLEFYINRKSQGISFYNLRRHQALYPMICSTAAQSSMRLIYAASWQASLLVDAAKILAASVNGEKSLFLPPGLKHTLKSQFWLTLPNHKCILDVDEETPELSPSSPSKPDSSMLSEFFSSPFMNGYYVDNVERDYRIVVWE
ncbi:SPRY domain-containing SOCS box protein 3-like isoform X1 [Spodoptera litura]|uniref:SPRY domain-containing SOCS box protein 3-like isoform X1 n=1 Tax=Spodoptera litura TaxID=69820 RepID=A0A9J7EYD4_SPOLT|nr:SPRY domain-containing SOCS box protein 3-like isoform X1 [Spodoptera litura]